jgi:hypothetical protein
MNPLSLIEPIWSLPEISLQFTFSLFQDADLYLQPLEFAVDPRQFSLCLLVPQTVVAVFLLHKCFHFPPEEPKPRVAMHRALPVLELANLDCADNFVLCQPELLTRRLVAKRRALAVPFVNHIAHRLPHPFSPRTPKTVYTLARARVAPQANHKTALEASAVLRRAHSNSHWLSSRRINGAKTLYRGIASFDTIGYHRTQQSENMRFRLAGLPTRDGFGRDV